MMTGPTDIVGRKTIDTGERDQHGLPLYRHEPLTRAEAEALWERSERRREERAARMPDEKSAIDALFEAWYRLKELGWSEAMYCPKDGSHFQVIEPGSTGIFDANYQGKWPEGSCWIYESGDISPSHAILFKRYPKDQAEHDAKMAPARKRFQQEINR